MLWYPLRLFQSHAVMCGCPPTEERDAIQTLKCSHERTVQLTQPVSLFKYLYFDFFVLLSVPKDQMALCKFCQSFPCSGVVGTNSPLILLMPELGLLYILNSSDPLCRKANERQRQKVRHSCEIMGKTISIFQTGTQTQPYN